MRMSAQFVPEELSSYNRNITGQEPLVGTVWFAPT